jgi:acetyltransferase-like isoleucine patch superfamily enzyme
MSIMAESGPSRRPPSSGAGWRIVWAISTALVVQTLVVAAAVLPVLAAWTALAGWTTDRPLFRAIVFSLALPPSYAVFALLLMAMSAISTRALGWKSPPDAEMPIADMGWPLLGWVRYMIAIHVVRILAGLLLKGSPVWTAYLRLAGARLGRRVYINSLAVSDYNLLEFGDGVVIGADVHIAGHTVERGVVKTGTVRLGRNVLIGIGTVVDIGIEAGDGCHVAALSFVPKYSKLEAGATYAGLPVRRVNGTTDRRSGSMTA